MTLKCWITRVVTGLALAGDFVLAVPVPNPNDDWAATGPATPILRVGESLPPRGHAPQFPPKDARTLFSEVQITTARDNVARYPAARAVADKIIKEANYWADWTDKTLRAVVPTAEVPRCCSSPSG